MRPEDRAEIIEAVVAAIKASEPVLTEDEVRYVKLALKKEAQKIKRWEAVIEKSLGGLAWAFILGLFYMIREWAINHGYKP